MGDSVLEERQSVALDEWEIKERLFLASVVRKAGFAMIDWKEASVRMDVLCDREFGWRPWDWYSPKNCEAQYNHMLDTVVGSRKDSMLASGGDKVVENAIYNHFAEKRKAELNALIYGNQVWYKEKFLDVKLAMKRGDLSQDKMWELYNEVKQKDESIRLEKMRKENQRRERKRMQELQSSWKSTAETAEMQASTGKPSPVDINVEEIIGSGKPVLPTLSPVSPNQPAPLQTSTSPLLSSLLKSPTTTSSNAAANVGTNSVRATAPTITSLLTSGSMPNPTQPAITLSSNIPAKQAVQILTRPISGPPSEVPLASSTSPQNLKSPSQSAPTLSMLLEKSKSPPKLSEHVPASPEKLPNSSLKTTRNDCNNEEVPMDIEENALADEGDGKITSTDSDEHDANEEQQLLEVFKNIGNIEELDIDVSDVINEEVDFLKDVDEEPPHESADIETKLQADVVGDGQDNPIADPTEKLNESTVLESEETVKPELVESKMEQKFVIPSSDDSNDNIPLAAVAYFDNKEKTHVPEETGGEAIDKEMDTITAHDSGGVNALTASPVKIEDEGESEKNVAAVEANVAPEANETEVKNSAETTPNAADKGESTLETLESVEEKPETIEMAANEEREVEIKTVAEEISLEVKATPAEESGATFEAEQNSTADTDDDSSTTSTAKREDKHAKYATTPQQRRKQDRDSESSATSVRAHNLRKLRDRDRSESPMIEEETAASVGEQRYSSTPTIDTISPISTERDERELKNPKHALLSLYQSLQPQKYAGFFVRIRNEPRYDEFCCRPMDFQLMKKNIESGAIQSFAELRNAAWLMAFNAASVCKEDTEDYNTVLSFKAEIAALRESNEIKLESKITGKPKEAKDIKSIGTSASGKVRGFRKSLRN